MSEFTAHIRDNGEKQTVKEHLENASTLCSDFASKIGCKSTGKLIGILHDQGKYTQWFNNYILQSYNGKKGKKTNHSSAGAQHAENLADKNNSVSTITSKLIAEAICCHHSGLCDNLTPFGTDQYQSRLYPATPIPYAETYQNFSNELQSDEELENLFNEANKEIRTLLEQTSSANLDTWYTLGMIQKFLFSCLIDADRLDTALFMQKKLPYQKQDNHYLWDIFSDRIDKKLDAFSNDDIVSQLRKTISSECKNSFKREPGVYTLNCPTGAGKTLASMRYALHHAKEYKKDHIFYIIPFTTIIDQNADSIRSALNIEGNDTLVKNSILEIHSNLVNYNETEEDDEYKKQMLLLTERMDYPIILTTMVRFLESFFGSGTQNPRAIHQFANSIIIFDEIQALPVKCVYLFNNLINFLVKICGATVVLCTATQPLLHEAKKPIILSHNPDLVNITEEMAEQFKRVDIENRCKIGGYDKYEVANLVMQTSLKEEKVLVVMNTKSSARAVFEAIKEQNLILPQDEQFTLYFLSTAFCPKHRRDLLKQITEKLNPNSQNRIICVTTQLIEAGVDISFNAVFRAIAGLDSIVQAAGRCNRNGNDKRKTVTIFNPSFENLSKLEDIQIGARQTKRLLDQFESNKAYFDNDLLSKKSIQTYFQYYFSERESCMGYPITIKEKNTELKKDIYDLLSDNANAHAAYMSINKSKYPSFITQSFETAGEYFHAIDSNTTAVIVPYKEGKDIIVKLNQKCSLEEKISLLKQAQQYSVNLFKYEKDVLENQIYPLYDVSAFALNEGYYSEVSGVVFESLKDGASTV